MSAVVIRFFAACADMEPTPGAIRTLQHLVRRTKRVATLERLVMRIVIALVAAALLGACASQPVYRQAEPALSPVPAVDTERYLGRWYEIARYPNGFQKECEAVTATYSRRDDGLIKVVNACGAIEGSRAREAVGRAKIVDPQSNAKLKVSFFGPFWGDYWIIDLKDDYSRAIVGEPSGRYLWVLARAPAVTDAERAEILATLDNLGYPTEPLHFTRH
jgi:apolipoprotein D and lipocalin family protein